ncbi:MAG: hypothetical protein WC840_04685 [Candidatus Peribacteraceae bacterium]
MAIGLSKQPEAPAPCLRGFCEQGRSTPANWRRDLVISQLQALMPGFEPREDASMSELEERLQGSIDGEY